MPETGGGWTFLKVLGLVVSLLGLVGFGLCALCGFTMGFGDSTAFVLSQLGAGIAAFFGWIVVGIFRSARKDQDRDP